MAFPSEANILRRTLTAFATLVSSLKSRQWGLIRNPSGNYSADGYNRNSGSLVGKDEQGLIHEFWERAQVETYVGEQVAAGLSDLAAASSAGLQVPWTAVGVEWAKYDSTPDYEFDSWTASPSGNYTFSGSIEYAIDSFGNLLLRGYIVPPVAVSVLDNDAGLRMFRISNAAIDSSIAGALGAGKYAPMIVTAIDAGGNTEPLWFWKGWFAFESSNSLSFLLKDDSNGGFYARPGSGQVVQFTRVQVPKVAPVATGSTGGGGSVYISDTMSVNLSGDGSMSTPLSAEVRIDPLAGNQISESSDGLYVPAADFGNFRFISNLSELAAFFAEDMLVGVGLLGEEIILNHGLNSFDFRGRKQLYFGAITGHSDSDLEFNLLSGYGSLYIYSPTAFAAGGSINFGSVGMQELFLKRASKIGGAVTYTASGWGTSAKYEAVQDSDVTMGATWTQSYWDDTSGDSKVSADTSDGVPGFLVDKLCDGNEAAFTVAVVGGVRKVKIPTTGAGLYSVANWTQLKTALEDTAAARKFIVATSSQIAAPSSGTNAVALYGVSDLNFSVFQGGTADLSITAAGSASIRLIQEGAFHFASSGNLTTDSNSAIYCRRLIWGGGVSITGYLFYEECQIGTPPSGSTRSRWFSSPMLAPSGAGLMAKASGESNDSFIARSIAVTASQGLSVTNGDGVAGNPTISLAAFTSSVQGAVPAPVTPSNKFLRDDGTWQKAANESLTKDPTGWDSPTNVIVTYDSVARTINLKAVSGTATAYYQGTAVLTINDTTGTTSAAHSSTLDNSYFYFYDGASWVWSTTPWDFSYIMAAFVYYGTNDKWALRECHGLMPWQVHKELHSVVSTYRSSGGVVSGLTYNSTTAAQRRPAVSACVINDEDIETTNAQIVSGTGVYTQLYLTGAGATSLFVENQDEICPLVTNHAAYNEYTGGAWQLTACPSNRYFPVFLVAIPAAADANSQKMRFLWFLGQNTYANAAEASAVQFSDLNKGIFFNVATEFIAIERVIIQGHNTANSWVIDSQQSLSGSKITQTSTLVTGMINPMTSAGDLIKGGTAGVPIRVPIGTARQALQVNSGATDIEWAASAASTLTEQGDTLYASAANTLARLPKGTQKSFLQMNAGATAPFWSNNFFSVNTEAEFLSALQSSGDCLIFISDRMVAGGFPISGDLTGIPSGKVIHVYGADLDFSNANHAITGTSSACKIYFHNKVTFPLSSSGKTITLTLADLYFTRLIQTGAVSLTFTSSGAARVVQYEWSSFANSVTGTGTTTLSRSTWGNSVGIDFDNAFTSPQTFGDEIKSRTASGTANAYSSLVPATDNVARVLEDANGLRSYGPGGNGARDCDFGRIKIGFVGTNYNMSIAGVIEQPFGNPGTPAAGIGRWGFDTTTGLPIAVLPSAANYQMVPKMTAKGQLATFSTAPNLLPVGSNDLPLVADSTTTNGITYKQLLAAGIADNAVTGAKISLTSEAAGDIMYCNGTDWVRLAKGAADGMVLKSGTAPSWVLPPKEKSITIENPTGAEKVTIFFAKNAITLVQITGVLRGSSTPSVTYQLKYGTDPSGAGTQIISDSVTSTTAADTNANTTAIAAGNFIWLETSAKSGSVTELHVTMNYTEVF
jgi:hypothetical protein